MKLLRHFPFLLPAELRKLASVLVSDWMAVIRSQSSAQPAGKLLSPLALVLIFLSLPLGCGLQCPQPASPLTASLYLNKIFLCFVFPQQRKIRKNVKKRERVELPLLNDL